MIVGHRVQAARSDGRFFKEKKGEITCFREKTLEAEEERGEGGEGF